jgi:hypothetical protein
VQREHPVHGRRRAGLHGRRQRRRAGSASRERLGEGGVPDRAQDGVERALRLRSRCSAIRSAVGDDLSPASTKRPIVLLEVGATGLGYAEEAKRASIKPARPSGAVAEGQAFKSAH